MRIGSLLQVMNETLIYDQELEDREREVMRIEYGTDNLRIFKNPERATKLRLKQTLAKDKERGWMKDDSTEMEAFHFFNKPGFEAFHNAIAKYENSPKEYGVKQVYGIANAKKQKAIQKSLNSIYKKGSSKFYGKPVEKRLHETLVYDAPPLEQSEKDQMMKQYGTTNLRIFKDPNTATRYQLKRYNKWSETEVNAPHPNDTPRMATLKALMRERDLERSSKEIREGRIINRVMSEPGMMKYNTHISKYENDSKTYTVQQVFKTIGHYTHDKFRPQSIKEYRGYWNKVKDPKFLKQMSNIERANNAYNKGSGIKEKYK